jgi:hypothetical protein
VAVPAGAATQRAALRVTDERPVTVAGTGFAKRERVTVRFAPKGAAAVTKVVRASTLGRFTVVFSGTAVADCSGYVVSAAGGAGTRARLIEKKPPCGIDPAP